MGAHWAVEKVVHSAAEKAAQRVGARVAWLESHLAAQSAT
eukprot:CAMPEP_0185010642 /NCGR_PEP_ID=MMETSP1098-20130426/95493_1 /TAXON_ID=89044 /ORGANISM="Spumella elongata, Strain CCAP 955/1" /LENGTH=39 /DNA_ID= /DNA_START= /DNA_END= /DNA_ORIENTATION=